MKKLFVLGFSVLLCACAAPDYNYVAETTKVSEPALDSINTVYVGDVMVKQGKFSAHRSLFLKNLVEVGFAYDLYPGYYLKQGEDNNSETFYPSGGNDSGRVDKAFLADPWQAVMTYKNKNKVCVVTVFNVAACKESDKFDYRMKHIVSNDSFQQTLIYSGKVGDKINISYREFSDNYARPAFNNDVEYDLRESSTIGYKGAKLEIIEATNEHIKYRVIRNFNNAAI